MHLLIFKKNSDLKEIQVSNRTIRRSLRRRGYSYDQCRKIGQLAEDDLKRLIFARKCQKLPTKFWTEGISFYLDGTGWVRKTMPKNSLFREVNCQLFSCKFQ